MGWLFGRKKKVPKVSFPEGQVIDESALRFPASFPSEQVIEPSDIKLAAGFEKNELPFSREEKESEETLPPAPKRPLGFFKKVVSPVVSPFSGPLGLGGEPLYVKVDVYQRILGEMDGLKSNLSSLSETSRVLENSEYNEEHNFDLLRKNIKLVHDRLLQVDKILFKMQGD